MALHESTRPLVVASNRLPVSLRLEDDAIHASRSSGGLAAALGAVAEDAPFDWVGWPGCVVPEAMQARVREVLAEQRLIPLFLTPAEEQLYYHGISNQAIWPLFHYFTDRVDFQEAAWNSYVAVNHRFAAAIAAAAVDGARVWIHDFHLMLVPQLLRDARPDLEIGFFLHIPFPSSEIYRLLPTRQELLRGLLGADLVGFHSFDYARHFRSSCVRVLGAASDHDSVQFEGRRIEVGAHPIGIDVAGFEAALDDPETARLLDELHQRYGDRRVVLGVERLDYTKGIAHKLRAFERLLERRTDLAGKLTLLQIIVPSRLQNADYTALKSELEEMVGRINGRFAAPGVTPVEYLHRSFDLNHLVALYRFASACLVTPVRDGMNLVAQEFAFCQEPRGTLGSAHRGMLVLSEFAGAAHVLPRALLVNPWDTEGMARTLETALDMPPDERSERMTTMAMRVQALDCRTWADGFLGHLTDATQREHPNAGVLLRGEPARELCARWHGSQRRVLFLDYDGTLREIVRTPEDAVPDASLRELLRALAADPHNEVHIVSGRHRHDLERWLGDLGVHLCAEHGFAWRDANATTWRELQDVDLAWIPAVHEILQGVCQEVPGTRVERKPCALAWHYRLADADYGPWRARELLNELEDTLARLPVEVVHGHRVIEVRPTGVHKGVYVSHMLGVAMSRGEIGCIVCMGDDRTDRDMFRVLPAEAIAVHVGGGDEMARFRLESPARTRALLTSFLPAQDPVGTR